MPVVEQAPRPEVLVDEDQILSPGAAGRVFNPIVIAEFRRWRARPFTYLAIVILVFAGIILIRLSPRMWVGPAPPPWRSFGIELLGLLIRPSSILPLLMVWRALVSFRDGGLFKPFRTTFLTPGDFLWGVVAVPFIMSGLILMVYTGFMIAPDVVAGHFQMEPDRRNWAPFTQVFGVLTEGSINGAAICFLALYFGVRGGARLSALFPIAVGLFVVQMVTLLCGMAWINRVYNAIIPAQYIESLAPLSAFWKYAFMSMPKLFIAALFWRETKKLLHEPETV